MALKSVMSIIRKRTGSVVVEGRDIVRLLSERIAALGVAFCPEECGISASFDVKKSPQLASSD
jgi:branched-chain amino acid transport system ATP-binding protein